jgi:hypothetical protein
MQNISISIQLTEILYTDSQDLKYYHKQLNRATTTFVHMAAPVP